MNTPNPEKIMYTQGVMSMKGIGFKNPNDDYMFSRALWLEMWDKFRDMPDVCTDGGNDKHFFTFNFRGKKLFAAENEIGGLTIMLPNEY